MINSSEVRYSPQSSSSGSYDLDSFTGDELSVIEQQAREILKQNEWVIPLIPESIVKASVQWYAQIFIEQLISQTNFSRNNISLEAFQATVQEYLVTYNLQGAKWFKEVFVQACLEELKTIFGDLSASALASLMIEPIKVTSSTGAQSFGKARIVEWDGTLIKGKRLLSLDDIGDRGVTQQTIKEQALSDGALSVTTVNMIEKMVPNDAEETAQKKYGPEVALLRIGFFYVLGWGLDDGVREETRDFKSIIALSQEIPQTS